MTEQPPSAERRADGSIHVTLSNLPGFHFILKSGEGSAELLAALDQFLGLYLPALIAQRVSAETERCATVALEQRCEPTFVRNTMQSYKAGDHTPSDLACTTIADKIRAPAKRPVPPQQTECDHHWIGGNDGSWCTKCKVERPDADGPQSARRLTQGEVNVMNRALRRSTRLIHEGELAPASTGEQPETPVRANLAHTAAVVDYTERALAVARDAVEGVPTDLLPCRSNSEAIAQAIAPDIDDALAAVASGHQAALLARLQEPDVREAIARSIARSHFARKQHYGVCTKEARLDHLVEQYWDQFISDADAAIARIAEMLK